MMANVEEESQDQLKNQQRPLFTYKKKSTFILLICKYEWDSFFIGEGIISLNVISNSKQTHLRLIVAKASDGQQYLLPLSVCKMWRWEGQQSLRSWWPMLGLNLSIEAGTWAMTLDWSRLAGVGVLGVGSRPRGWLESELRGWNQSHESRIGTLSLGLGPQG